MVAELFVVHVDDALQIWDGNVVIDEVASDEAVTTGYEKTHHMYINGFNPCLDRV